MKNTDDPTDHDPLGLDYYFSHFEEPYYVPALLWKAMEEMRYGDIQIVWGMMIADVRFRRKESSRALKHFFRSRKLKLAEMLAKKEG